MTQGGNHKTERLSDFFLSVRSKYGHADVQLDTDRQGRMIRWGCRDSRSDFHFTAARQFSHSPSLSVSCPQWGRWWRSRGLIWAGAQCQPIRSQDWAALTNQKPGKIGSLTGALRYRIHWYEAREREESRLNLTAFNEPKPRHLLISAQLVLCGERGSMHCYVCIYRLKSLNVSDTIFICFRQLFCNNVLSNG